MSQTPPFNLVSFRMDRSTWKKFLKLCRSNDRSASEVLRTYIKLTTSRQIPLLDKPSPAQGIKHFPDLASQLHTDLKGGDHQ